MGKTHRGASRFHLVKLFRADNAVPRQVIDGSLAVDTDQASAWLL